MLTERPGDANLAKAQVVLPKQMQLDQSHIQAPCTRPQFAANQCPDASVIGTVTATSPLVDYPLTGPVYLRTGNNPLPDVVLDLTGRRPSRSRSPRSAKSTRSTPGCGRPSRRSPTPRSRAR